jgi:hypothetical protein
VDLAHPRAAFSNSVCCPGNWIIGGVRSVPEGDRWGQRLLPDDGFIGGQGPAGSKEQRKMKWLKKGREPEREPAPKPAPKEPTPHEALRIEELEERIVPNAIWSD